MNSVHYFKYKAKGGNMINSYKKLHNIFKSSIIRVCLLIFYFTFFSVKVVSQNYDSLCYNGMELEKKTKLDYVTDLYSDANKLKLDIREGNNYSENAKYYNPVSNISQTINLSSDTISLSEIRAIFYEGLTFLKAGDTTKAKTNALRILELDPSKEIFFSGEHLLGIYDLGMRRKIVKQSLDDAKTYFAEYKTTPSQTTGKIKLAQAFAKLNKAWLYSSGIQKEDRDLSDTINKYILEVYPEMKEKPELPELARKYMVQANSATDEKNYDDAIKLLNKASSIAPYFPLAYFNRALLRETIEDYTNATADMKKYVELSPDASNIRAAKDKIYEWEGKIELLEDIVKKYSVANKLDKIAELSTIKIKAQMSGTMMGTNFKEDIELWMKNPDKLMRVFKVSPLKFIDVFDGEKGYMMAGSKKQAEMTPDEVKQTLSSIVFQNRMANYLKKGQLLLEGEEKVNDRAAFKIKVKGENIDYEYIDKESYLLVKSSIITSKEGKTYTSDSYPSNYTETNGVFLPMKTTTISQLLNGEEFTTTTAYEKVEVNIPMDDSIFKIK